MRHGLNHLLVSFLGRFMDWRARVPWLMRPLEWTVSADEIRIRLHCGCGQEVRQAAYRGRK